MIKPEQVYDDRQKDERGTLLVVELESIAKLQSLSGSPVLQVFILLQSTARVGQGFHGTSNNVKLNVGLRLTSNLPNMPGWDSNKTMFFR